MIEVNGPRNTRRGTLEARMDIFLDLKTPKGNGQKIENRNLTTRPSFKVRIILKLNNLRSNEGVPARNGNHISMLSLSGYIILIVRKHRLMIANRDHILVDHSSLFCSICPHS